jgi:serine/threonine protein kinase
VVGVRLGPSMAAETTFEARLTPGMVVAGKYRIESVLGGGGMSTVYRAMQLATEQLRALKILRTPSDPNRADPFLREARITSHVRSDHVVDVIDAGVEPEGIAWIAMELLEGQNLATFIRDHGAVSPQEASAILGQVCDALAAAHREGIVHLDLKADNVYLARSRSYDGYSVKMLDFGIAQLQRHGQTTATTTMTGTPISMAPEQIANGTATPATDVWALGLLAFLMFTGRIYWKETTTLAELVKEILLKDLVSASKRALELGAPAPPAWFDEWFSRCVARDPAVRCRDADEAWRQYQELAEKGGVVGGLTTRRAGRASEIQQIVASPPGTNPGSASGGFGPPPQYVPDVLASTMAASQSAPTPLALPSVQTAIAPWAALGDALPTSLRDSASAIESFFEALFTKSVAVARHVVELQNPRVEASAEYRYFAVFMADGREQDQLLTRTFEHYAGPLESHLREQITSIDATKRRKVVIAVVDAPELGGGVRDRIFQFNRDYGALVVPLFVGDLTKDRAQGNLAREIFENRLFDFHTFPDVFAIGAPDATAFFGMSGAVNEATGALISGNTILLVHGSPGSGKTCLVERARYGLRNAQFANVRCNEALDPLALVTEIVCQLAGENADSPEKSVRERIHTATIAARQRASSPNQRIVLFLDDADAALLPLTDESATPSNRSLAQQLLTALVEESRKKKLSVVMASLTGFVLTEGKLRDWPNPAANHTTLLRAPPLSAPEVKRLVTELGRQINVAFADDAVAEFYAQSAGNVSVVRRLCSEVVAQHRKRLDHTPLVVISIAREEVSQIADDLAATGGTFKSSVMPWLSTAERYVLRIVAKEHPKGLEQIRAALRGQCTAEAIGEALERLRQMGFIERRDGEERVVVPLMERWAREYLEPTAGEVVRRRKRQVRLLSIGLTCTTLLVAGYWLWMQGKTAVWHTDACQYEVDYPGRAVDGAEVSLSLTRDCGGKTEDRRVPIVLRPHLGTLVSQVVNGQPSNALEVPDTIGPDWLGRDVKVRLHGTNQYVIDVVHGPEVTQLRIGHDWMSQFKALLAIASVVPLVGSMLLAFHGEIAALVRRLLGKSDEEAA